MIQKFHPIICPSCKSDLTCEEAVTIHFSAAGHEFDVRSDLDFNGYLIDPENLVINGYHAGTHCSQCNELLDEVEPSSKQRFRKARRGHDLSDVLLSIQKEKGDSK